MELLRTYGEGGVPGQVPDEQLAALMDRYEPEIVETRRERGPGCAEFCGA